MISIYRNDFYLISYLCLIIYLNFFNNHEILSYMYSYFYEVRESKLNLKISKMIKKGHSTIYFFCFGNFMFIILNIKENVER